jgi:hypothetical protein
VETTTPSIVTDDRGDYVDVGTLSTSPVVTVISDGRAFSSVSEEAGDAKEFRRLLSLGSTLLPDDYNKLRYLNSKYDLGVRFAEGNTLATSFDIGPSGAPCTQLPRASFNSLTVAQLEERYCGGQTACFSSKCWRLTEPAD